MLQKTEQIKRRVSVNLTARQKRELCAMSDARGIGLSVLVSLLIRYFVYGALSGILTLDTLLKAYQTYQNLQTNRSEKKTYKITLRITEKEFQKLNDLAARWFYLPGELTGILVELLTAGIIDTNSIWDIQPAQSL
ncbi:MAG: hypothetical protein LBP21_05350 [Synergistaceae bacterium]|jgi:hypothetical protein|nr:hypothetical protein [Synergistaceae bacterium]